HGLSHARSIAARPHLDERIANLISSIGNLEQNAPDKAEETRSHLRAMMKPAAETAGPDMRSRWNDNRHAYKKLRIAALSGVAALFISALADVLDIPLSHAREITKADEIMHVLAAFRVRALTEEQAFLILHCLRPERCARAADVSSFTQL